MRATAKLGQGLAVVLVFALTQAPVSAQVWAQMLGNYAYLRCYAGMVYDSQRGLTVLHGGTYNGASGARSDTWELNGTSWTQLSMNGPARCSHAMVYDSQRGRTLMFGGTANYSAYFGDTWEWDGAAWTQVSTTGPAARQGHAMAYDSQRGMAVLFGGVTQSNGLLGDTWEWDGAAWTLVSATGPSARQHLAMAYDSQRGKSVLFGGLDASNISLGETWEWNGSSWLPHLWATGPVARYGHGMVYDSQFGRTVLFGGQGVGGPFNDTWEWDGLAWVQAAATGPAGRFGVAMAYDSQFHRTVLHGGTAPAWVYNDTWLWTGSTATAGIATPFGVGCGSPSLALSPVGNARPVVNTTAQVTLGNIPASLGFVAVGWSNTTTGAFTLPLSLAPFGMPGCDLLQSAEYAALQVSFTGPGTANYNLPLPNWSGLIGLHIYLQGWANAPGANTANVIVSNGVEWVIGNT